MLMQKGSILGLFPFAVSFILPSRQTMGKMEIGVFHKFLAYHYFTVWVMISIIAVIGETTTFVAPNGLTFLSNGEWQEYFTSFFLPYY